MRNTGIVSSYDRSLSEVIDRLWFGQLFYLLVVAGYAAVVVAYHGRKGCKQQGQQQQLVFVACPKTAQRVHRLKLSDSQGSMQVLRRTKGRQRSECTVGINKKYKLRKSFDGINLNYRYLVCL